MPNDSTTRTAIVTGAGRGIGRSIAVALGGIGCNVTVNYHNNTDAANDAAELVRHAGGNPLIVQADIADSQDRHRLLDQTCDAFGAVDLLVNNAGVAPRVRADLLEATEDEFDFVLQTNLKGPYFLTQLVARHMIDRRQSYHKQVLPAIINLGSVSAYAPSTNRGEYCVAKAGIAMMTTLFAARLAEHGIHVYEIRAGIIATDMTAPVKDTYDKQIREGELLPIARWGRPEDVAAAAIAIAEGHLPYSTGQVINVDGGFHLRRL